jgi:hypothetical protein
MVDWERHAARPYMQARFILTHLLEAKRKMQSGVKPESIGGLRVSIEEKQANTLSEKYP